MYKALIIAVLIAFGLGYALFDQLLRVPPSSTLAVPEKTPKISQIEELSSPIPELRFSAMDGTLYTLHDFEDKVIILNFWATWCPPCVKEFPDLLALADVKYDEVILILMSVDDGDAEIERFTAQLDEISRERLGASNVILARDVDSNIAGELFGSYKFPETYIIDSDLLIKRKVNGIIDWLAPEHLEMIESLVK